MKSIKMILMTTAIVLSAAAVIATKPCLECETATQYFFNGSTYVQAGTYGVTFDCVQSTGICTYYKPDPIGQPSVYAPCRFGLYIPF